MSLQNKKQKSVLPGIIVIAVAIIATIASFVMSFYNDTGYYILPEDAILVICLAAYGVLMLFVKIKSYGWGIASAILAAALADAVMGSQWIRTGVCTALFAMCMLILVYKNYKR